MLLECAKQSRCPGCPGGAEPYEQGLARKGAALATALARYPALRPELAAPRSADPTVGYRLRAKLVVEGKRLGLFERGTHRVIDVEGCRVLSPTLARASQALRGLLPLPIYGADLRDTSEGVLITLLTEDATARPVLEHAASSLESSGVAVGVAISVRSEGALRLLASGARVLRGPAAARHRLSELLPYSYAAHGSFVQAHARQASYVHEQLLRQLVARLSGVVGRQVLELFAGSGGLALALAKAGARVTAVESYAPAISLAERAASEQGLSLEAHALDATRFVLAAAQAERRFEAVVVNPPRRGLEPALRLALAELQPTALAYVSCNPETLARDLAHFARLGLQVSRAEPLDMIPWSDAVEALCFLVPAPPVAPEVRYEDESFIAVSQSAYEARADGMTARVRSLAGCSAAQPAPGPGPTISGLRWFAKQPADVEPLAAALAQGESEYVALVRGNLRKQGTLSPSRPGPGASGTRYKKERAVGRHSLVRLISKSGDETEPLRAFAGVGHPVLGDSRFGDPKSNQHFEHRHGLDRPFFHAAAQRLELGGALVEVQAPLVPELIAVIESADLD